MAKDLDTWLGNSLATILAGLAVAAGVIGLLVAFGYINDDAATPFEDGLVWMIAGIILAIAANVFRREHHVVDADMRGYRTQPLSGGSEGVGYDTSKMRESERYDELNARSGSGTIDDDVRRHSGTLGEPSSADDIRDDIRHREGRNR
jgi:hypothetical protein